MTAAATVKKATTKTPPLHVLRGIFRLLKTPELPKELFRKGAGAEAITGIAETASSSSSSSSSRMGMNATQQMLMDQYRQSQHETCPQRQQQLRLMAVHYHNLKQDLAERNRLYKLDTGAEVQLSGTEMSRRAAARAGLQLPKLYPDLEE